MKSKLLFFFLIAAMISAGAQTPQPAGPAPGTRPRANHDEKKESSSFLGDADNLDPMQVKDENIKDDEEPVLEDIRDVLNKPEKPATTATDKVPPPEIIPQGSEAPGQAPAPSPVASPSSAPIKKKKIKKAQVVKKPKKPIVVRPKVKASHPVAHGYNLQSDDPDYNLEQKFHNIYNTYNAKPTSVEAWSSVLMDRKAEVYVVQKGDTLWSISKTLFADPLFWPKIWSLNRMGIVNPHFITPGLQVLFYSGDGVNIPSLAVGTKKSVKEDETGMEETAQSSDDKTPSLKTSNGGIRAGVIPDSLPLSRNDNYFLPPKVLEVQLKNDVDIVENFENDILLANNSIKSEIELSLAEISKGRCGGNHIMKGDSNTEAGATFNMYEPLETLKTDIGKVYAYRYVGQATALGNNKLKVTKCNTVMSEDLLYVSPQNVEALKETKISKVSQPEIMGGPNLGTQSLFSNKQMVYINLGSQPIENGQSVFVHSQLTEEVSGEIKILEKFGSFAIGVLTEVDDLIQKGDSVTFQR